MVPQYEIGQRVRVTPDKNQQLSPRDAAMEAYAGQSGTVTKYHWISSNKGEVFYIYTVKLAGSREEVVLHEDELSAGME